MIAKGNIRPRQSSFLEGGILKRIDNLRIVVWLKKQPKEGLVFCISLLMLTSAYIWSSWDELNISTVDSATTLTSTTAQVAATFAGFLVVALLFLIDRRRRDWEKTKTMWVVTDVVLFGIALVVFAVTALLALDGLGYILSQEAVDDNILWNLRERAALVKIGLALVASGFGFTWSYEYAAHKRTV